MYVSEIKPIYALIKVEYFFFQKAEEKQGNQILPQKQHNTQHAYKLTL